MANTACWCTVLLAALAQFIINNCITLTSGDNALWTDAVEMLSEAVKILKGEYALRAIKVHKMDKAIIFCRTKVDCDNMETYLNKAGGGNPLQFTVMT